jgi:6-pyruvoyltetrahydropterin/6-carboxytetrahydropterin synthase
MQSCGASYNGQDVQIWKEFTLDSSVISKRAPDGSKRKRLHGYTYTLRLHLSAPLDVVMGWAVDFGDVKDKFNPIFKQIDHKPLHEIADLQDTDVANLSRWILNKATSEQPEIYRVDLFETKGCGAISFIEKTGPILPI